MPDVPLLQDAERLERTDAEAWSNLGLATQRQLGTAFMTNPAGQQAFIVRGFNITNPSAKILRVDLGVAILSSKEKGQVVAGNLVSEGSTPLQPDLAAYTVGLTYGVYVRFEQVDGDQANRVFWDPVAGAEYGQTVVTRKKASWGINVSLLSPGAEWFKIADVLINVGNLTVTKKRFFYFEGDENASYATGWGGGNDRNNDRSLYGVGDLGMFARATLQKLKEIQGTNWWLAPADPLSNKVSRSGDLTMTGAYQINSGSLGVEGPLSVDGATTLDGITSLGGTLKVLTPNLHDVGEALARFRDVYARYVNLAIPGGGVSDGIRISDAANTSAPSILLSSASGNYANIGMISANGQLVVETSGLMSLRWQGNDRLWFDGTGGAQKFYPDVNNVMDLGTATLRFKESHLNTVSVYSSISLKAGATVLPVSDGTHDLGDSTHRVRTLFAGKIDTAGTALTLHASGATDGVIVKNLDDGPLFSFVDDGTNAQADAGTASSKTHAVKVRIVGLGADLWLRLYDAPN